MKEVLYTIPVNEGFEADDECPFCFMERAEEERALRYVAGNAANYMETTVRAATARVGFCTHHMKSLYDFGNSLGAALLLQWGIVDNNDPFLYGEKLREYLLSGAKRLPGEEYPNPLTGWGRLCINDSFPK